MAHEIEGEKFVGTQVAWHRIGTLVDHPMTAQEALNKAGLDTYNELQPMFIQDEDRLIEVPNKKAVVRVDDLKILGIVGNWYKVIQNRECFDFMDSIIGEGRAVYETAGSLRGGTQIFLTVKFPQVSKIGPDKIDQYVLLTSSHDGSIPLRVMWTPVRVVCANTMGMALSGYSKNGNGMAIRHTRNYQTKIAMAREVLQLTEEYYRHMEVEFQKMLKTEMTKLNFEQFVEKLFPEPKSGKESSRRKADKEKIADLFANGRGIPAVRNTRWAALNAVVEFVDHHKRSHSQSGRNLDEVRMESGLWGQGQGLKQKAYDLLHVN